MASTAPEGGSEARGGERRGTDRRTSDRRARDRRAPPPLWRRWWALVSYGVLGALGAVLVWNAATDEPEPPRDEPLLADRRSDTPTQVVEMPPATGVEDAFGPEGYERLVVGGEASLGRVVRAELYCSQASNFTIIQNHPVPRSVARLIQEGRVPAAECKWGARSGQGRPDLLLLVPPERADDLATAPVVVDNYVERRRVVAEIEWIGRSETLALRTAGILRRRVAP